ncbi:MAG: methyltransferase domain-containing protein [Gammaproteobacteria bacterium]|nr:methyltransferase domain-containing protein [Gammaproteobacteria bacterium]MDH3448269.1 methyltransferase domain-containing protein [Gammaproteobacteria bacterium]
MEKYDKKAAELIERSYQTPEIVNQRLRTLVALALTRGESVLDAGCGTGLLLEQEALAVGREGRAAGIDFSEDMLTYASARCAGLEQVRLQQGSVERLPFDDASFDALSCTQTLLYVDDLDRALTEFYRVLKPRGRIAVLETDWNGAIMNSHDQALTQRIFGAWDVALVNPNLPKRLRPLLTGLGFANLRVEAIPILNASYAENSFSANMLQNYASTARRRNIITADEADEWLAGINRLIEEDAYFFCVNRFLFTAVK